MKLHMQSDNSVTLVDNLFIDRYMAGANGEYVKLYLYLLRCVGTGQDLSVSSIADFFDHTEKDVQRALAYWEKLDLLKLKYDESGSITDIVFCDAEQPECAHLEDDTQEDPYEAQEDSYSSSGRVIRMEAQPARPEIPDKRSLSAARKRELREEEDIRQLFFVAETYLGRVLSSTEANNLLYFYDTLGFSFELVEYLIEYCASKGNPGARYMEKVAIGWYQDGIRTAAQAKRQTSQYSKDYYQIFAAFGIKGRAPAAREIEYMDRWLKQWDLPVQIVQEACSRTILQVHEPSFSYADKILKNWHEQDVSCMEDIAQLDAAFTQKNAREAGPAGRLPDPSSQRSSNRFNNFRQRQYDFQTLEQKLLRTQARGE